MDRIPSTGSPLPLWSSPAFAGRDAGGPGYAPWAPLDPGTPAPRPAKPDDPAAEQGAMQHFMSHVSAECFISLLQTMDPPPFDSTARGEYRRYYGELRESLEIPMMSSDGPRAGKGIDQAR